ncbi:MAG TPA: hypothetical protein VMN39_12305 [Longimicrobiaceae bacterium]|nr:hypothetical protein [Longimicrobiaceae bacterium]
MTDQIRIQPTGSDAVRTEIENTRARLSATIDEIEEVLFEKKHQLLERFDVMARVRERPLQVAGLVFGVGLLLGFLSGGPSKQDVAGTSRRASLWETRARRLLEIARAQEEEIEALEGALDEEAELDEEEWEDGSARFSDLRNAAAERLSGAAHRVQDRIRSRFLA